MATYSWPGYTALMGRIDRLVDPDPTPLLEEWEGIIREDNRRGVLAGIDCNDRVMPGVTYRPVRSGHKKPNFRQQNFSRRGIFAGLGAHPAGTNNNLTSAEYRRLGGPALAPRGPNSRVITNLNVGHTTAPVNGVWEAIGVWEDVASKDGVYFLPAHFRGRNRLPARDLRGVRKWGKDQAVAALHRWGLRLLGITR